MGAGSARRVVISSAGRVALSSSGPSIVSSLLGAITGASPFTGALLSRPPAVAVAGVSAPIGFTSSGPTPSVVYVSIEALAEVLEALLA